jgi:hypothetical protein
LVTSSASNYSIPKYNNRTGKILCAIFFIDKTLVASNQHSIFAMQLKALKYLLVSQRKNFCRPARKNSSVRSQKHDSKEKVSREKKIIYKFLVYAPMIFKKMVMIPVLIRSANIAPMIGTMRKGLTV